MHPLSYKKTRCLNFPECYEIKLFKIFLALNKNYGATYMSYTFDKSDMVRFSFRSDSSWASIYQNETISGRPIIELCPIDVASREKKNQFIIWDLYSHSSQPKKNREIMGLREDAGLSHGLTLSMHFDGHHDGLAVATEEKNNDLAVNIFLDDNAQLLKHSLLECRKEFLNLLKNDIAATL
jgi:hypothetical protein